MEVDKIKSKSILFYSILLRLMLSWYTRRTHTLCDYLYDYVFGNIFAILQITFFYDFIHTVKIILFILLLFYHTYFHYCTLQGKFEGRDMSMSLYGLKDFSSSEDETLQVSGCVSVSVCVSISGSGSFCDSVSDSDSVGIRIITVLFKTLPVFIHVFIIILNDSSSRSLRCSFTTFSLFLSSALFSLFTLHFSLFTF